MGRNKKYGDFYEQLRITGGTTFTTVWEHEARSFRHSIMHEFRHIQLSTSQTFDGKFFTVKATSETIKKKLQPQHIFPD
jgi:hypothetical protein